MTQRKAITTTFAGTAVALALGLTTTAARAAIVVDEQHSAGSRTAFAVSDSDLI